MLLFLIEISVFPKLAAAESYSPASGIQLDGIRGTNGIYYGDVKLSFDSGIEYSLDQGVNWKLPTSTIVLVPTKGYNIWYRTTNSSSNNELTIVVKTDTKPPLTTAELLNSTDGYTKDSLKIQLSAIDNESGVQKTQYSTDMGLTWMDYSSTVTLTDEAQQIFSYRSIDKYGNVEKTRKLNTLIDKTPPNPPSIQLSPMNWTKDNITVSITDGLDQHSGTVRSEYQIGNNNQWTTYSTPFVVTAENQDIYARSIDAAGNISVVMQKFVPIDQTPPSSPTIEMSEKWEWLPVDIAIDHSKDNEEINRIWYEYKLGENGEWKDFVEDLMIDTLGETPISFRSFDEAGNYSPIVNKVARFDDIAPTEPTAFKVSNLRYNRFDLSWSGATDNIGIKGYDIYTADDQYLTTVTDATYQMTGLAANTTYTFKVVTYDNAYNESGFSKTIEVTTHSRPDFQSGQSYNMVALRGDGRVWTWGIAKEGSLGDGTTASRDVPKPIPNFKSVKAIFNGNNITLAQKVDGSVWGWGGYPINSAVPIEIKPFDQAKQIYVKDHTIFVVQQDDMLWAWGKGTLYGSVNAELEQPTKLNVRDVKYVEIQAQHILIMTNQGALWTWGMPSSGLLGVSPPANTYYPFVVKFSNAKVAKIAAGTAFDLLLNDDGTMQAWGYDQQGQLGNNRDNNFFQPAPMYFFPGGTSVLRQSMSGEAGDYRKINNIRDIVIGENHALAVDQNNELWGWGSNTQGLLMHNAQYKEENGIIYQAEKLNISRVKEIVKHVPYQTDSYFTLVITTDNRLIGWGNNKNAVLGTQSTAKVPPVVLADHIDKVAARAGDVIYTKDDETFWMLGNGVWNGKDYASYATPVKVDFDNGAVPPGEDTPLPTVDELPEQPAQLELKQKGAATATINWTQSEQKFQIEQYRIFVDNKQVGTSTTKTYTLTGLQPAQTYVVTVEAVSDTGKVSNRSEPLTIETATDTPSKPADLKGTSSTLHTVDLVWQRASSVSPIKQYIIFQNEVEIGRTSALTYSVKKLRSASVYEYTVQSVNEAGKASEYSDKVSVSLEADIPTIPKDITMSKPVDGSAAVSWTASTSQMAIQKYIVRINDTIVAETSETKYTLSAINKNKLYNMTVTAVTEEGLSSAPGVLLLTAAPINLSTTDVDMYTKKLSWEIADDQKSSVKTYNVYLNGNLYKATADTHIALELLIPGKLYTVQVTAISNTDTQSPSSEAVEFSTIASPLQKKFIFALNGNAGWIKNNANLLMWGSNIEGQLGDGTIIDKTNAIPIDIQNVKQLSSGGYSGRGYYTLAVTDDGKLWGWGTSYDHAIGDLSPHAGTPKPVTLSSKSIDSVMSVTSVYDMNYILKTDGTIWRFGAAASELKQVEGITSVVQIVGKYALKTDGTVWKYTGDQVVQLKGLSDIQQITYSYGLKLDGSVWKWTSNGNTDDITVNQVTGLSQVIRVESGGGHLVALKQNGTVWTLGINDLGQLGDGTKTTRTEPVQVASLTNVVDIAASGTSSFAVLADGTAWSWGFNYGGRLGDGTTTDRLVPVRVMENTPPAVTLLEPAGSAQSPTLTTNPKVTFKWAQKDTAVGTLFSDIQIQVLNEAGEKVFDSGTVSQTGSQLTSETSSWIASQDFSKNIKLQAQVRVKDGSAWSDWSSSGWFQVIDEPVNPAVFSMYGAMGWLKADGSVWMWGRNNSGQLGDGTSNDQPNAIPVNIQNVKQLVSGDSYTLALKTDGSLWGWGSAYSAELGVSSSYKQTPRPVRLAGKPLQDIQQVVCMYGSNYILKNDGTVWYFGSYAELRKVDNLASITQLIRGYALKNDGTVWNYDTSYPYQVPDLTNVQQLTSDYVLKQDGTVWKWSHNSNYPKETTLTQVSGLTQIAQLQDGMALKKDGTVWTWGESYYGQLGDGTTSYRQAPAQVKGLSQVVSISSNGTSLIALQADGTAWSWGLNDQGQLGDSTKTNRLTPVRVIENTPPSVKLLGLGENAASSVTNTNPRGDFKWEQTDTMANTLFSDMQIQVLDEKGVKIVDSGEIKQDQIQMSTNTGSWLTGADLPENVKLQVHVRVKDGSMWSDWSQPGWFMVEVEVHAPLNRTVFNLNGAMGWIKADGSVWMWGQNSYGELGDGTSNHRLHAIPVEMKNATQLVNGDSYVLALKTDGTLWGWGTSQAGKLGAENVVKQGPKPIVFYGQPVTDIQQVSTNGSTISVLKNNGTVWYVNNGLRQISNLDSVAQLYQYYAVKTDGTVWRYSSYSVQKAPEFTNVYQLTARHILKKDGTVWKWTYDSSTQKTTLTQVSGLSQIIQVQDGMALKKDGTVWTWGNNTYGQLGDGTNTARETPAQVSGLSTVSSIASNGYSLIAVQTDGTVWTWGDNTQGQLGDGTKTNRSVPGQVVENTPPTVKMLGMGQSAQNAKVVDTLRVPFNWEQTDNMTGTVFSDLQIRVLDESGQQILDSGELKPEYRQRSIGKVFWIANQDLPENVKLQVQVRVKDGAAWSDWSQPGWFSIKLEVDTSTLPTPAVFMSYARMAWTKADGSLWMSGQNNSGQLGDGTTVEQLKAVQVLMRNVKQLVSEGSYTLALKTDGSLWGWGMASDAGLGDNTETIKMPSRMMIEGQPLNDIQQLASMNQINFILKNDGTVWYFGKTATLRQVPNLSSIIQITRGRALKNDGTVWEYDTSSAQVISGATNVQQITSSTILKKDGTVWDVWYNGYSKKFVVQQVSGLSQVTHIQTGMAVKKDGSLWTWGDNSYGQLGDGTQKYRQTAAQVSGLKQITSIYSSGNSVIALQADGTAWSWGDNYYGQLGDGTKTNRLVPVKVLTSN